MKIEKAVNKISNYVTILLLYIVCAGTYLSAKGFVFENGKIYFVNEAKAASSEFASPLDKRIVINFSNPHFIGEKNAPITIYEYSSFGCTHCADFHLNTLKKLDEEYIKTGKVKVALVYFPIDKKSMQAAMIASCIPDDEYHNFVDMVFKEQREWMLSSKASEILSEYASHYGLSQTTAMECTKNDIIASEILGNRQQGASDLNITGTPTFVVDDGKIQEVITGEPSYSDLKKYLDEKLLKI